MTDPALAPVIEAVRANCLRADAGHARDLTLCNYLLAMREMFRWESGLPLGAEPPRPEVLAWISAREAAWDALDDPEAFEPIPVAEGCDPFDVDRINARLLPLGWVYGAGRGRLRRPQFFLAELAERTWRGRVELLECGREWARGIDAPPAMLQEGRILLRREAFERALRLRAERWDSRENAAAMARALEAHGHATDPEGAIARLAHAERETLILHELGEHEAGDLLGPAWDELMDGLGHPRDELAVRAVRDLLADCRVALPELLRRGAWSSLHFWFANLSGPRRTLFPALANAYSAWTPGGDGARLREAVEAGRLHWETLARSLLEDPAGASRLARGLEAHAL